MRSRLLGPALGLTVVLVLVAAACQSAAPLAPPGQGGSSASGSATPSSTPTVPPADRLVTIEVCGLAAAATGTTTTTFNEQMSAFELAAARDDRAAMEAAAKAINDQFLDLGRTVTRLAVRPIDPALRRVLTDIAAALDQMTALSYTGTTVDQRKKLVDFTLAIGSACASATAVPTTPAG